MNHRRNTSGRLLAAVSILGLAVLAACAPGNLASSALSGNSALSANTGDAATFCHATGDLESPYELVTITGDDFGPAPVGGCPTSLVVVTNAKILICHATTDEANPYKEIAVSINGLNGHATHEGDFFPVPEGGCAAGSANTLSAEDNADLNLNADNNAEGKITICHATSSATNPYNEITVSVNGLNGHDKHADDIIPAPAEGCPAP